MATQAIDMRSEPAISTSLKSDDDAPAAAGLAGGAALCAVALLRPFSAGSALAFPR